MSKDMNLLIFDLYSGTGSATQAFKDNRHSVITFELDTEFKATEHCDVGTLNATELSKKYGKPDFIWASPPCTCFSVASIGHHWGKGRQPKTQAAKDSLLLVQNTLALIKELSPKAWLMENPRGMLRTLEFMKPYERRTITYCQYGDTRMKPTDLWGVLPCWEPRPMCKNGQPCHEAAPRGAKTGTQGIAGAKERSRVPYALSLEICKAVERLEINNNE
jgi:hypothetical protein